MQKAQGSLEYLILIAVVLAIISVVTLIAINYVGSQQGKYSYNTCKNAAANCKAALAANPKDKCSYCDTECKNPDGTDISTKASTCCRMGKPDSVYEGATGDDCDACFSDSDCTPKVCNPLTKKCVTPACMTANDLVCRDPNPATTGDGLCVSRLCVNPGAYNAYCDTIGKYEPTTVHCGDQAPVLACLAGNGGYTTTATPLNCSGLGVCNRPDTPTVTTTNCNPTQTKVDTCEGAIGVAGYDDYYYLRKKINQDQCVSTPNVHCASTEISNDYGACSTLKINIPTVPKAWTTCQCAVCTYHKGAAICFTLDPSQGVGACSRFQVGVGSPCVACNLAQECGAGTPPLCNINTCVSPGGYRCSSCS